MKNHDFAIDEIDYHGFLESIEKKADKYQLQTVKCNNCGTTSTIDVTKTDNTCPYCADDLEIGRISEDAVISPWGMVPFQLEAFKAKEIIRKALKKKWFKPLGFNARSLLLHHFQAVYIPFWTFDCKMKLGYVGKRGDEVRQGDTVITYWTDVTGNIDYFFDDIVVAASGKATNDFIKGLAPWDLSGLEPYSLEKVSGAVVEKYQVDVKGGMALAEEKIHEAMELFIRTDIGGEMQEINRVWADYEGITFKHILLPVYTAAYQFRGKSYPLVVDGKTGKFFGKVPKSLIKIAMLSGVGLAAIVYLMYLFVTYLP